MPITLLSSCPHTLDLDKEGNPVPAGRGNRDNLCIELSRDDGKTWPVKQVLDAGKAAFSDSAVIPDGTVLCVCEADTSIDCARFNLNWITQYLPLAIVGRWRLGHGGQPSSSQ
jgi:hypothetical protein